MPNQVVVYTTSWCADCSRPRRLLRKMGIPFKEIDVEEVDGADAEVRALTGGSCKVPTIRIDDVVLVEPTEAELRTALEAKN